jgi:hypothetical protein
MTPHPVEVTQEDRDAAADVHNIYNGEVTMAETAMRTGSDDDHPTVQAFARHRLTSSGDTNTLADELEACSTLTYGTFSSPHACEVPIALRDRILASLRQSPAPVSEDVEKLVNTLRNLTFIWGRDCEVDGISDQQTEGDSHNEFQREEVQRAEGELRRFINAALTEKARLEQSRDRTRDALEKMRSERDVQAAELTRTAALLKEVDRLLTYEAVKNGISDELYAWRDRARQFLDNLDKGGSHGRA